MKTTEEIYERIESEQIIENKGYRWYIECCLNFVEREILPTFWHLDFYAEMRCARDFLAQKISAERLFEMEKIAYENIENFEGQDREIACLIRWCLNGGLLSVPEQKEVKKSKFFGAKHEEIIKQTIHFEKFEEKFNPFVEEELPPLKNIKGTMYRLLKKTLSRCGSGF